MLNQPYSQTKLNSMHCIQYYNTPIDSIHLCTHIPCTLNNNSKQQCCPTNLYRNKYITITYKLVFIISINNIKILLIDTKIDG